MLDLDVRIGRGHKISPDQAELLVANGVIALGLLLVEGPYATPFSRSNTLGVFFWRNPEAGNVIMTVCVKVNPAYLSLKDGGADAYLQKILAEGNHIEIGTLEAALDYITDFFKVGLGNIGAIPTYERMDLAGSTFYERNVDNYYGGGDPLPRRGNFWAFGVAM